MCQSEPAQHSPDSGSVNDDAVGLSQFSHQFIERDLAFGRDTRLELTCHAHQPPVPAAIALLSQCQQSGFASQLHQIVDKFWQDLKVPLRLAMPIPFVHIGHDPRPKLQWMWLSYQISISASAKENCIPYWLGILKLDA